MGVAIQEGLTQSLRELLGDHLRVVAEYDQDGYQAVYIREGIGDRVKQHADEVHNELVLQGIDRDHIEDLFDAGDLHCSMHRFEELTAFHFSRAEYGGLFVTVDTDIELNLERFIDTVNDHLA